MAIRTEVKEDGGFIHRMDGPVDLLAVSKQGPHAAYADSWHGGFNAADTYRKSIEGDESYIAKVEAMLEKVSAKVNVETSAYRIDNAIVGFAPDVPSAIIGVPECMITMEPTQSDMAPVTVWCNVTTSAGVSADNAAQKGAAVAALVLKLQALRPVALNVVIGLDAHNARGSNFVIVPITSRPFSMAQLSFILCNPGWARHTYWTVCSGRYGYSHGWDAIFKRHNRDAWAKALADETLTYLSGDIEHDIYIPPLFLKDPLLENPVKWVEDTMARYMRQG